MNHRTASRVGVPWSEIGLGCWQLGSDCWGDVDGTKAQGILRTSESEGIDFLDTADVYGGGVSERAIGTYLKSRSDGGKGVFVATKLGRKIGYPGPYSLEEVRQASLDSRANLGVEKIDLTQLHCVPLEVLQKGDIFDWLRQVRDEGIIERFGASIESVEEGMVCLEQPDLASLQVIFNVLRQKPSERLLDAAAERGVAIIVRLPLASGLLSGRLTKDTQFAANDHRNFNRDGAAFHVGETFNGLPYDRALEAAEALARFVPGGMSMAQMSLRWILDHPAVTTIIPGASRPEQVKSNASAAALPPLSPDLHKKLAEVYQTYAHDFIRGSY